MQLLSPNPRRQPWRSNVERWACGFLDLILPYPCLECHETKDGQDRFLGLCPTCRASIPDRARTTCDGCASSLWVRIGPSRLCGRCLTAPPPYRSLTAGFDYQPPINTVIHALKFKRLDFLGQDLARAMVSGRTRDGRRDYDLITSVPLSPLRLLQRGYNQAEAIAIPLARGLRVTYRPLLRRRARIAQSSLPRERRLSNLRNAFTCRTDLTGYRVLLIDDVVTTGSTAAAATIGLLDCGAKSVDVAVAARTPRWSPFPR